MRKVIKSGKEINKEIEALFDNYKNDSELADRIKNYLANISGKELYTKREIENLVSSEIFERVRFRKIILEKNSPVFDLYPRLNRDDFESFNKNVKSVIRSHLYFEKHEDAIMLLTQIYLLIEEGPEMLRETFDQREWFPDLKRKNPVFAKLHSFLFKNSDVAEMLHKHVNNMNRETIVELILSGLIPLQSILLYFDIEKDIKENTIALYELLRTQIPRVNIQSVITDNIEKIKSGKFSVPFF